MGSVEQWVEHFRRMANGQLPPESKFIVRQRGGGPAKTFYKVQAVDVERNHDDQVEPNHDDPVEPSYDKQEEPSMDEHILYPTRKRKKDT
jgi:hypothetical protein